MPKFTDYEGQEEYQRERVERIHHRAPAGLGKSLYTLQRIEAERAITEARRAKERSQWQEVLS